MRAFRIRRVKAALLAAAAAMAFTAPAAHTQARAWACDPWAFCGYYFNGGEGAHLSLKRGASDLLEVAQGRLSDHVWSVKNISGRTWCLYSRPQYQDEITKILDGYIGDLDQWVKDRGVRSLRAC
ncbi:peptidase inhibitor family I36 protein [Nonomuraea sp. NPDC046570]|uniref:peptidase inhibitor family I36 protein n=1 Tax=Nonomuraea sp. NPDC046570 TaxID=3155255 RepID=UPI0033CA1A3B